MVIEPSLTSSILSCGCDPSTVHPTDWHVPRISFTVPERYLDMERGRMVRAMSITWSMVILPLCLTVRQRKHFFTSTTTTKCTTKRNWLIHVPTVFLLLSVSWRLLEGLDNERSSTRNHLNFCLPILDGQFDCDLQSFPLLCCLCNIISYFLRWLVSTEKEEFWNSNEQLVPRLCPAFCRLQYGKQESAWNNLQCSLCQVAWTFYYNTSRLTYINPAATYSVSVDSCTLV